MTDTPDEPDVTAQTALALMVSMPASVLGTQLFDDALNRLADQLSQLPGRDSHTSGESH